MTGLQRAVPGVSVVIPTRGRVEATGRLLASLATAATRCPEPVEVIVVDDSTPDDAARHQKHCALHGFTYVRGPRHVGAKRNHGVRHSSHDLLLFIDSDCRASADLLRKYVSAIRSAPDVHGLAGPTTVEYSASTVFRFMRRSRLLHGDLEKPSAGGALEWATTSNLLLRREAFDAVGGFVEESLTVVAGEDVDLGIRLTRAGFSLRAQPDAEVVHDRLSAETARSVCRRLYVYGRSEQWLTVVHPDRREPRLNPVTALGVVTAAALAGRRVTAGRSLFAVPLTAAAALGLRARGVREPGSGARGVADAVACAALEHAFDLGAVVAAFQLRRPALLFTRFRQTPRGGNGA